MLLDGEQTQCDDCLRTQVSWLKLQQGGAQVANMSKYEQKALPFSRSGTKNFRFIEIWMPPGKPVGML